MTGQGYGQGVFVRYDLLPDKHNDVIFAVIGHQWGFIGCLLILVAYGVIVICGIEVATVTNDPFGRLLAVGVVIMIVAQALINIGMTLALAPITGMTLPFVSYGGSSLWANFLALGLLVNVTTPADADRQAAVRAQRRLSASSRPRRRGDVGA